MQHVVAIILVVVCALNESLQCNAHTTACTTPPLSSTFYPTPFTTITPPHSPPHPGGVPLGVGDGTTIENAIVDKNARIGRGCVITNKDNVQEAEREEQGYIIRWVGLGLVLGFGGGLIK